MLRAAAAVVTIGLWLTLLSASAAGQEATEDEIDYLALTARLLADGHVDKAADALAQVDRKQPELNLQRYYSLAGTIALRQKDFPHARDALKKAIKLGRSGKFKLEDKDTLAALSLFLAQVHYGLKEHAEALAVLEQVWRLLSDEPNAFLIRAQSAWALGKRELSLKTLAAGAKRFKDSAVFTRLQVFYLIELGLFQEVRDLADAHLAREDTEPIDFLTVGEALRRGKQYQAATLILEGGHLRFPEDDQILLSLAHCYIDQERTLSAALVLEDAARLVPKYTIEAAELYKKAGRLERALSLNARVEDQKGKVKQRMGILLQQQRFELVATMQPALSRLGVLEDDAVRYGLAYAFYKVGDFAAAEAQLKRVTDPKVFDDGNELRRAMQKCRASGWECI